MSSLGRRSPAALPPSSSHDNGDEKKSLRRKMTSSPPPPTSNTNGSSTTSASLTSRRKKTPGAVVPARRSRPPIRHGSSSTSEAPTLKWILMVMTAVIILTCLVLSPIAMILYLEHTGVISATDNPAAEHLQEGWLRSNTRFKIPSRSVIQDNAAAYALEADLYAIQRVLKSLDNDKNAKLHYEEVVQITRHVIQQSQTTLQKFSKLKRNKNKATETELLENEFFRYSRQVRRAMAAGLSILTSNSTSITQWLRPCQYEIDSYSQDEDMDDLYSSLPESAVQCSINDTRRPEHKGYVIYNPSSTYPRTYCEKTIQPQSSIHLRNISACPTLQRIIGITKNGKNYKFREDCDVPCVADDNQDLVRNLTVEGTNWTFLFSMEGPQYYPELRHDRIATNAYDYTQNLFWATTSMEVTIPLPYFSWDEYNIEMKPPINPDKVVHGASFIARNCASKSNREKWVNGVMKHIHVDSLSTCHQTATAPPDGKPIGYDVQEKLRVMRQYMFHLNFENQIEHDYVTEKMWGALESGTLGVYLGAPNVMEQLPHEKCVVLGKDFKDGDALGKYLAYLEKNLTAYMEYHEWRKKPLPEWWIRKFNFTHVHSACRMCRYAYGRMHGLPWHHESQSIRRRESMKEGLEIQSKVGVLVRPFKERWVVHDAVSNSLKLDSEVLALSSGDGEDGSQDEDGKGDLLSMTISFSRKKRKKRRKYNVVEVKDDSLLAYSSSTKLLNPLFSRKVIERDGFVDMIFESSSAKMTHDSATIRLESGLQGHENYYTDIAGWTEPDGASTAALIQHNITDTNGEDDLSTMSTTPQGFTMATLISIQDEHRRFTVITESGMLMRSTGGGMIDLFLGQQLGGTAGLGRDANLLNQLPYQENVRMRRTFRVILEIISDISTEEREVDGSVRISKFVEEKWDELRHPLFMFQHSGPSS